MPESGEDATQPQEAPPSRPDPRHARRSPSRKLLPAVLLTLLVVLSIVVVTILHSRNANRQMFKLYRHEQRLAAFHQAAHFRQRIERLQGELHGLSLLLQQEGLVPERIDARLADFLARLGRDIDGVGYMDAEGTLRNYRNANGPQPPTEIRYLPHVRQALAAREVMVSDTLLAPDGVTGLIVHAPMLVDGQFRGSTLATIASTTLEGWLPRPENDRHGFSVVLDSAGIFLHHPDPQFVNTSIHAPPPPVFDGVTLGDRHLRDGRTGNIEGRAFRSRTQMAGIAAANVLGKRFLVIHCAPYDVIAEPVVRASRHTSALTGLTFLVTALGFVYAYYLFNLDTSALVRQSSELRQDIRRHRDSEELHQELIGQLEMKNAELERFAYTVSHDLKSPLITIRGFLGMLEKDIAEDNEERIQSDMNRIANATENMQRLLDELLELSRVGRLDNPLEDFPLSEITDEVLELLDGRMQDRHIDIHIHPGLPVVHGDRPRFREVMQNLVENALKFMGDQPEPRLDIGVRQKGGEQVVFVKDNGIGLDMEYADRIFHLFEQLDPTFEGTGMGLAMVKRILEHAGSRIWVESEGSGTGCTFCFTVPPPPEEDAQP